MKTTDNYGLKKPEETDFYDVQDQNDNMDIIDAKMKEIEDAADPSAFFNTPACSLTAVTNSVLFIFSFPCIIKI